MDIRVKKALMTLPALWLLAGCDGASAPQAFTPEMASFSNEFDFDPLRGPVKDFSQTLMNEKGEVAKRITGTVSEEGCFDTLEFHNLEDNSGAALVLNANFYLDAASQEKRVKLQGKCQLAELPAAGITYDTNDSGFVVKARGKDATIDYRYDAEGYPLGKVTVAGQTKMTVLATVADNRKKLDYTAVSTLNDKTLGRVKQSCDYDRHFNPVSCKLEITDESASPPVHHNYTIKNTIDYY
ncbi:YnfC family lipoprotein [Franconibacter helveticus 513]|uniref:YnfC family lipoprotein n=2 Tax=Franconibacter helveticus TaxID=357240 RepID=UPI000414B64D|nr:YnfC family lipoprotein [Franconibacter helveticus]